MERKKKKKGVISVSTMRHIGSREEQQDSFGFYKKINEDNGKTELFAIVADGMGGLANGSEVSGVVVEAAKYYFMNQKFEEEKSATLTDMVYSVNEDVLRFLRQATDGASSGSTMVAAYICGRKLNFVSVGDSRIYLFRKQDLIQLNREHTQLRELYRLRREEGLSYEEIMSDREKGALTSYMGIPEMKEMDYNIEPISLKVGDKLLLMSDGIFGTLSKREMIDICMSEMPIADTMRRCVLEKAKPTQDNMTVVVLEVF